jgi:hypothetical protein
VRARYQPAVGWTVVLRRQPARLVEGQPEGGYTERIRGRYTFAVGIAAYGNTSGFSMGSGRSLEALKPDD